MTSFAFIFGVLPLLTATGAGAEMRQALGTVVFWGMIGVTFFGIFLTPVFFKVIRQTTERMREWLRRHSHASQLAHAHTDSRGGTRREEH
jgi:hypothetical protein